MQFERNGFSVGLLVNGITVSPDEKTSGEYFEVRAPGSGKFTLDLRGKEVMVFIDEHFTLKMNPSVPLINPTLGFYFSERSVKRGYAIITVEYDYLKKVSTHIPIRVTFQDAPSERRDLGSARPTIPDR